MIDMFILLTVFQLLTLNEAYNFTCPSQSHWNIRAQSMCKPPRNYTCLFNVTFRVNIYRDTCSRPRILGAGYKYVFQPNLNRATCSVHRYQPFIFDTIGHSDCIFQKSLCNGLGQETYETGNTTMDRKCICNTKRRYTFVRNSKNECYCNPLIEDCSCYLRINSYNKTIELKDVKCFDDREITGSPNLGEMSNISRTITIIELDNFNYNLNFPTNEYRINAANFVLTLLLANFAVCIIVHRILPRWIQFHNTPKIFGIVECTDRSITIEWCMDDKNDFLMYELGYRVEGTDKWTVRTLSNKDVKAVENGRRIYQLLDILPETSYELKMCSVDDHAKSKYTESRTKQTRNQVLPEAIHQSSEEDKNRFKYLMKTEKTEKRYFVRIMIVGKESAGKTCLLKRLLKEDISNVTSTDGVDIVVRRCKINIEDGKWIIGNEINDDKMGRIKRALNSNAEDRETKNMQGDETMNTNISQLGDMSTFKKDTATDAKYSLVNSEQTNESSLLVIPDDVTIDANVNLDKNENTNDSPLLVIHEDFTTNTMVNLDKNEDTTESSSLVKHVDFTTDVKPQDFTSDTQVDKDNNKEKNESSSLEMPADLMSNVFSTSTVNTPSNLYALCELWDFAGQKEFYATHQTFLTSSAVYLVVADMEDDICKQDLSQCFADFQNIGEYIDFWFDSIHCHRTTDEPHNNGHFDPAILLVFTGKDKYDKEKDLKRREKELYDQIDHVLGFQSKYHHLRLKCYVSNTIDTEEEFEKLQIAIYETAREMDNWGNTFPLKWILLEHLIEINKSMGTNFISLNEMYKMAQHEEIQILEEDELLLFLRFQHNIGNIIYFENVRDLIILKPQWLADAFRCLVSDRYDDSKLHHREDWTLYKRQGKISESLITELFASKDGSQFSGQKTNLHKVMENMDIIVKIEESSYIIPSKMPSSTFDDVCEKFGILTKNCKRTSWVCFKFEFLPPSFFNHLSAWFIRNYYPSKVDGSVALYRGICMFDFEESGCKKILVTMSTDTIALQVVSFFEIQEGFGSTCCDMYGKVKQLIEIIKERYKVKLSFKLHFKCSDGDYYRDTFEYDTLKTTQELFCSQHRKAHLSEQIYSPWIENEVEKTPDDRAEIRTRQDDLNPIMSQQQMNNYLKLVAIIVDVAMLVIWKYIREKIIGHDSFETFLNKEKHKLVHIFETFRCCQCIKETISAERLISRKQLFLLYKSDEGRQIRQHNKYTGTKLTQICICKYSARENIDIRVLDITLANFIIQKCGKQEIGIDNWINQIKDVRNELFTPSDIHELTDQNLSRKWRILEGSVLGIARVIGSEYAVETEKHIIQAKQLTIVTDNMLKSEIICRDYWRIKCAEFEVEMTPDDRAEIKTSQDYLTQDMSQQHRNNYLKLVAVIVDVALPVIWMYIREKILGHDSFETFLNKEKHKLVHTYEISQCCQCMKEKISGERLISMRQLLLLYKTDEGNQKRDHRKYYRNTLTQICICKYSAKKNIDIGCLDIPLATVVIQKWGKHELGIDNWIEKIKDVRNEIFSLSDIHKITDYKLNRTWPKLEGSILGIANVVGSECVVETEKHIIRTKKFIIASDFMLKRDIISPDYWRNKCAEFERAQNQVIEEKAAALHRTMPQQFSRMIKTDCQKTTKKIETLNTMVHMIHVMMKIFGSEENLEMFTEKVKEDLKRILIPVFMHIDIPTSWDKKKVFEAIDEFRLNETPEMIIRMKAISINDINMFAKKANLVICNVYELRCKINELMSTLLSEAEFDTTDQTEFGVKMKVQRISETLIEMVEKINLMNTIVGSDEKLEMYDATEPVTEDLQRILIPVFMQLDIPTSWDETNVFEAIYGFRINETPEMNIRIKALGIFDLKRYTAKATNVLCNYLELRSEINKMLSTILSEAEVDAENRT